MDVEDLKRQHEEIYRELQGCFGLERCLTNFNLVEANVGESIEKKVAGNLFY